MRPTLTLKDDIALAGIYPAVAQSFTVAATRLGISPQKVQAVVWVQACMDAGKQ